MNFSSRRRSEAVIDLTPMIDVVFQLLLFFMVTTTFITTKEHEGTAESEADGKMPGIEVQLPKASSEKLVGDNDDLNIWVTADGAVYLGEERLDLEILRARLKAVAADNRDTLVVIKADKGVSHGRVVAVMDAARQQGLARIGISTEESGKPGGAGGDPH